MKFEFSAGGIVYKKAPRVIPAKAGIQKGIDSRIKSENDNSASEMTIVVLVCQHSQHHGWVFPKGLIDPSASSGRAETKEEAALREVREETGINGKIIKPLSPIEYWYKFDNEKIKKTVYYFLMEYVSGDTKGHDFEMENVEWLPMGEVEERLTYPSDKKIWEEARKMIESI